MDNFIDWTTFICSVVVVTIISLATFFLDIKRYKQSLVTQAITANRINWIVDVRNLVAKFLRIYLNMGPDKDTNLREIFWEIRLYIHNQTFSDDYNDLFDCLDACCQSTYYDENLANKLIEAAQLVFKRAWVRIKIEGGQTKNEDLKIREAVDAYIESSQEKSGC